MQANGKFRLCCDYSFVKAAVISQELSVDAVWKMFGAGDEDDLEFNPAAGYLTVTPYCLFAKYSKSLSFIMCCLIVTGRNLRHCLILKNLLRREMHLLHTLHLSNPNIINPLMIVHLPPEDQCLLIVLQQVPATSFQ